jgi:hypothetical protein
MREYNSGDFQSSAKTFSKILKKYKAHTPSITHLALSLYKLEKYDGAYIYFSKLQKYDLPRSAYFEFAYSHYLKKKWRKAAKHFSTIEKSHPLYDLSMYYAGVCFYNLNKYSLSKKYLRRAIILPSRFSSSRRTLLKLSNKLISDKAQSPYQNSQLKEETRKKSPQLKVSKVELNNIFNDALLRKSSTNFNITGINRHISRMYFNGKNESSSSSVTSININSGLHTKLSNSNVGSDVNLAGYIFNREPSLTNLNFDDDINIKEKIITNLGSEKSLTVVSVGFSPWIEIPISGWFLGIEVPLLNHSGDFKDSSEVQEYNPSAYLESRNQAVTYKAKITSKAIVIDSKNHYSNTQGKVSANLDFPSDTIIDLSYSNIIHNYESDFSSGPASTQKLSFLARQLLPLDAELNGNLSVTAIKNQVTSFNESTSITADGTKFDFSGKLILRFSNWLKLSLNQGFSSYSWSNHLPNNSQTTWETFVPEFEDTFTATLSIDKNL